MAIPGDVGVDAVSAAGVPVKSGGRPVPVPRLEANPGELRLPRDEKSKFEGL